MSRVGIMGGTYNPPHIGHLNAAKRAAEAIPLDRLLLIPDNRPPHKVLPHGSADSAQRLAMTRLMAEEIPLAEASDMELKRGGRSYTVDTLRELHAQLPQDDLYLIIGTDMLMTLHQWREPQELCRLAHFAVVARNESDRAAIAEKAEEMRTQFGADITIVDCPALPVSSTEIREDSALCRRMTLPAVYAYIEQNGLYR